ncbi:FmdB family zinc ribbon protein [Desulfomarina profundi]|uniref:FmdB family zinc ribbon protein n=1 Tax=Desulfomarina profundi TaxID=2772557 RepID=UPI001E40C794|nr:FmdB family zinc ribbon protein [Desulfomarina profundi]
MPVYEYECRECENVFEVQQRISDDPLTHCPECDGPVRKLVSMSSFQLKGGGWYADGYSSVSGSAKNSKKTENPAPACQSGGSCSSCPAAAG